jgi:hypothetical protein
MPVQFIDTAGSFEDTTAGLDEALNRWVAQTMPEEVATAWVEATYPDFVIAGITADGGDAVEFVEIPYRHEEDVVTFGEPRDLAVVGVTADRWTPDGEVTFDAPKTIAASALSVKNATRIRRRLLVLDNAGVELTEEQRYVVDQIEGSVGGSMIPDESTAGSFDPAGTLSGGAQLPSSSYWNEDAGVVVGGQQMSVQWVTGTYYLDETGNLLSPALAAGGGNFNDQPGSLASTAPGSVDGSTRTAGSIATPALATGGGYWNENQGDIPKALPPEFLAKKKTRKRLAAKLRTRTPGPEQGGMGVVSGKAHPIDGALSAAAGLLASMTEVKALDGVDITSVEEAFFELVAVLEQAGILPGDEGEGEGDGGDETGVEPPAAAGDTKGLPQDDAALIAEYQRTRERAPV